MLVAGIRRITLDFESRGLKLRRGRWTKKEKIKLHANFREFVNAYEAHIGDACDLVVPSMDAERRSEVNR